MSSIAASAFTSGHPTKNIQNIQNSEGLRFYPDRSKLKTHSYEEQGLNVLQQRRRNKDPYAESFRERHAVGINAIKR